MAKVRGTQKQKSASIILLTTRKENLENIGRKTEDDMTYGKSVTGDYMPRVKSTGIPLIWWVYKFPTNVYGGLELCSASSDIILNLSRRPNRSESFYPIFN